MFRSLAQYKQYNTWKVSLHIFPKPWHRSVAKTKTHSWSKCITYNLPNYFFISYTHLKPNILLLWSFEYFYSLQWHAIQGSGYEVFSWTFRMYAIISIRSDPISWKTTFMTLVAWYQETPLESAFGYFSSSFQVNLKNAANLEY